MQYCNSIVAKKLTLHTLYMFNVPYHQYLWVFRGYFPDFGLNVPFLMTSQSDVITVNGEYMRQEVHVIHISSPHTLGTLSVM